MNGNGKITVFLADDHAMVREALAGLLAMNDDIEVVGQCGDGLEVVPMVRQLQPDVAVLDITMPGMNGLDVCRELSRKVKRTGVLFLTMHDNEEIIATALRQGASGYLLKEAAPDQLSEAIRAVARGEAYLGKGIKKTVLGSPKSLYETLTPREREVLLHIAEGKTNKEIAEMLGLAVKTVDTHRSNLMRKLNMHNTAELVKFAIVLGLIGPG